jgi:NAD(P)-dependent dehydrogenase (short-subunit alcohol dehydrogenase family)
MRVKMELFDCSPQKYASFPHWLRRQLFESPRPVSDVDLTGKVAIVTGANQGIGFEVADQLLTLKVSKLIIGARNEEKGKSAAKILEAKHKLTPGSIEVWKLDMLDYATITRFAERASQLNNLDIAVLNAGIFRKNMIISELTGHEEDIQTNYLSTVLLTLLLLPTLESKKRAANLPGRLTIVSSDMSGMTKFVEQDGDPLLATLDNRDAKWDAFERYGTSKLLGQLFLAELATHVSPSAVIINAANPGLCHGSGLSRDVEGEGIAYRAAMALYFGLLGRKPAVGAYVVMNAALKQGEKSHGQAIDGNKIRP